MMNNIDLVKALHHIWNTGDLALIDSVYAHDFLAHWPASSEVPERRGIDGIRFGVERIRTAFPDWHEQVEDVFGSGDRVASRYVSTGTHKGAFWGIEPTGRRIEIPEMSIFRIADGRIVEQWCLFDDLARLQQLRVSVEHLRKVLKIRNRAQSLRNESISSRLTAGCISVPIRAASQLLQACAGQSHRLIN